MTAQSQQAEPLVVIEDPRLPGKGMMYEHLGYDEGPQFRIGEVTKVFFGRSPYWLRNLQDQGHLNFDGRPVGGRRVKANNYRTFSLRDVEEIAHGLAQQNKIDGFHLRNTLVILDSVGRVWEVRK